MILDDPLPRVPDNPFDTPAWLDYLADAEHVDRTIDQLLETESSIVTHELIRYAVETYIRLTRAANQAREHLAKLPPDEPDELAGFQRCFWKGALQIADPAPPKYPRLPGDAF